MEKVLLVVVIAVIVTVLVVMIVKSKKKRITPTPVPTQNVPNYLGFLNNVETVIRNDLSKKKLATYFSSIKSEFEKYKYESGFMPKWTELLAKYNVPNPY